MGSCNVYGPNEDLDIRDFWALLSSACLLWVALCCIGGDFNVMQFPHEKKRGRRLTRSMGTGEALGFYPWQQVIDSNWCEVYLDQESGQARPGYE